MSDYIQVLSLAFGFSAVAFPTLFFATDRFCKACERRGVNANHMLQGD